MTRIAYVMEERPRTVTTSRPPASGRCQVCGCWPSYLVVTLPDPRWRCAACSRPPGRAA